MVVRGAAASVFERDLFLMNECLPLGSRERSKREGCGRWRVKEWSLKGGGGEGCKGNWQARVCARRRVSGVASTQGSAK